MCMTDRQGISGKEQERRKSSLLLLSLSSTGVKYPVIVVMQTSPRHVRNNQATKLYDIELCCLVFIFIKHTYTHTSTHISFNKKKNKKRRWDMKQIRRQERRGKANRETTANVYLDKMINRYPAAWQHHWNTWKKKKHSIVYVIQESE